MKAQLEHISWTQEPLQILSIHQPYFDAPYHFHAAYELTYIHSGQGVRFVGDHAGSFSGGEWVLVGKNIPHYWQCDAIFYQEDSPQVAATVVHLNDTWWDALHPLLSQEPSWQRLWAGSVHGWVWQNMPAVEFPVEKFDQKLALISLLHQLGQTPAHRLSHSDTPTSPSPRLTRVLHYLAGHYLEPLRLVDIAQEAHLAPNAFCRFFKQHVGVTWSQYLIRLRLLHAQRLLTSTNITIQEVCWQSGFQNLAHFHRYFKKEVGQSPAVFRSKKRVTQ